MKRLSLFLIPAVLVALTLPAGVAADPTCTGATATPNTLWPPNHKLKTITVNVPEEGGEDPNVTTIIGVQQDEVVNEKGDGNTAPDAVLRTGAKPAGMAAQTDTVKVRAERSGTGDGRIYVITYTSKDSSGECTGTVTVGVPHSQGNPSSKKGGRIPRDSGVRFNSLAG